MAQPRRRIHIDVGGLTCPKKGSAQILEAFRRALRRHGLEEQVEVIPRGCFGLCSLAPNLYVEPDGIWYSRLTVRDASIIVRKHLIRNEPVARLIHHPKRRAVPERKECSMTETAVAKEIEVGDLAPDFTLKNQDGQEVTLSQFRGKKNVVLAFYPFDWSPVCTAENCALSGDLERFSGKEAQILGISCDSHFSHKAWSEKLGLKHPLLSDLKRQTAKRYGLFIEELNCAKRATVVVDKAGRVVFKKVQEIQQARDPQEILAAIR